MRCEKCRGGINSEPNKKAHVHAFACFAKGRHEDSCSRFIKSEEHSHFMKSESEFRPQFIKSEEHSHFMKSECGWARQIYAGRIFLHISQNVEETEGTDGTKKDQRD